MPDAGDLADLPTYTHSATLIGKNKVQDVTLVIDASGIAIQNRIGQDHPGAGQVIARVLFQYVHKLCKASMRSRNAGTSKMLDVCLVSRQGLRELRMELSSAAQVDAAMEEFRVNASKAALANAHRSPRGASPALSRAGSFMHFASVRLCPLSHTQATTAPAFGHQLALLSISPACHPALLSAHSSEHRT